MFAWLKNLFIMMKLKSGI